jgi:ABC-2 type transport system ATP-binding protein
MKLMIAVALSHHARLLLLDEPTSGLDPVARDELVGILGEFLTDERHSVLFSTHITTDLDRIADYVTFVNQGRIVASAAKDELLDSYRVVRGGPGDLRDVGVELFGLRRTETAADALVRTDDVGRLTGDLVVEAPTLEQLVVRIGAPTGPEVPVGGTGPGDPRADRRFFAVGRNR